MAEAIRLDWLDALPTAVLLVQAERIVTANRAAGDLFGYSPRKLAKMRLAELLDETGDPPHIHTHAGGVVPVSFTSAEVEHEGQPAQLVTVLKRESSHIFRDAVEAGIDNFFLVRVEHTADGKIHDFLILDANEHGVRNIGLSRDELIGHSARELLAEPSANHLIEQIAQMLEPGKPAYGEINLTQMLFKDGWYEIQLIPIEGKRLAVFLRDITERRDADDVVQSLALEVEQQARLLDEIMTATPDTFILFDRAGRYLYVNRRGLEHSGLTVDQVSGKTWSDLGFPEEMGKNAERLIAKVLETGETSTIENAFPTVDGLRQFESIYTPLHDKVGEIVAIVITNHDITERKQIEEALRENQRLLTSIYETALVGIAVIDEQGHYVQVNQTLCEIYGYSAAELVGSHYSMMYPPDSLERGQDAHERLMRGEGAQVRSEWTLRRKNGQLFEIIAYDNLLVRENGDRFRVVAVIDITAQKQAGRALEESEQRLTSILGSMQDAVWSVRADTGELIYANPMLEGITGYPAHEFTADKQLLTEIVHAEDRERFAAQLDEARRGARIDTEYRITRRDNVTRWIRNRFWIVEGTEAQRIDGIMSDITDHRRAADQAMQLAFERERVRILSNFVRDASHEFRTPLSVINTRLYLLEKVDEPGKQREYIEGIREQSERILKLVESLITMSQLDSTTDFRFERIDLNQILTIMNVNAELAARRKGINFEHEMSTDTLPIKGETRWLMIAINAILDNAVNFTSQGGQITLSGARLSDTEVAVDVRDTGVGIVESELPHIFERFYRVDRARSMQGFGLGLPIARKIVEMHGGRIEIESAAHQGSLFRLIFPAYSPPVADRAR